MARYTGKLTPDQQQELSDLLLKNKQSTLSPVEEELLHSLHREADRLMLSKSYALALLKWRGVKVPAPTSAKTVN